MLRLAAVFCFASCAFVTYVRSSRPFPDGRIIGGEEADIANYPYQVSIRLLDSHICGGAIISVKHVLTAAHCLVGQDAGTLSVRAGSSNKDDGGVVASVAQVLTHPNYDPNTVDYDIGLITLSDALPLGANIQVVKLPDHGYRPEAGVNATVTGWGVTEENGEVSSVLRVVNVPIVSNDVCNAAYASLGVAVTDRMLCAGLSEGGKDACQGDSGGPLTVVDVVVGLVSWGYGCARPEYPGVYSNVGTLRDFIRINMALRH